MKPLITRTILESWLKGVSSLTNLEREQLALRFADIWAEHIETVERDRMQAYRARKAREAAKEQR